MASMCYVLLVAGGPPVLAAARPSAQRHLALAVRVARGRRTIGEDAGHRRHVADVAVSDTEERKNGGLASHD